MATFVEALRNTARAIFAACSEKIMWNDIRKGLIASFKLVLRLIALLPPVCFVALPLIAWLHLKDKKLRPVQDAAARQKLRDRNSRFADKPSV